MKISTIATGRSVPLGVCAIAIAVVLCGCPKAEPKRGETEPFPKQAAPAAEPEARPETKPAADARPEPKIEEPQTPSPEPAAAPEKLVTEAAAEAEEKPRDLGPPLVDDPGRLAPLSRDQPVWIDVQNKQVVLLGEVCDADYPLEFFASNAMKAYESVLVVNVTPHVVHAGLLRLGAKPGRPARFEPRFSPPTGTEIAIEVRWKDGAGKVQSAPARHWIRNIKTKKELDVNWVFAGSFFRKNEETGEEYYQADYGALICVLNLPDAMLDLPVESFGAIEARSFEAFKEHLPPAGTPVTVLLKPVLDGASAAKPAEGPLPAVDQKIAEAKRLALEAAENWLELVDRQQYSRGWETASERLNVIIARREFIKSLNDTRKPLGKVVSRKLVSQEYTRTIPDAPDGQYVIVEYAASFENKAAAVELVTLMLNGDNKWRVLGYHFK